MKRSILLVLFTLCITTTFAISKKKLIAQRDALTEKILTEVKFTTNFDNLNGRLESSLNQRCWELIDRMQGIPAAAYHFEYLGAPDFMKIPNEKKVDIFRYNCIFYDNHPLHLRMPRKEYPQEEWEEEWKRIVFRYPEVIELDKQLIKKKCGTVFGAIKSCWDKNVDLTQPHQLDLLKKYNQLQKEKVLEQYKRMYYDKIDKKKKEREEQVRKHEKQVQYRKNNTDWVRGTWLSGTDMFTVMNGGAQQYQLTITSSVITIQYLINNHWYEDCNNIKYRISAGYILLDTGDRIKIDYENGMLVYKNRACYKPY